LRENFSNNWFYLLKSDELKEALKRRDDFLKSYGDGNSKNNYYKLPKALRFIGPLQPLGELRAEKWLTGDWYLSGMPSYDLLKDIRTIGLTFKLPFEFVKDKMSISGRIIPKDKVKNVTDKEWDKHYIGFISNLPYTNIEIDILGTERIFHPLEIKKGKFTFAIMDFIEIYNQPDNEYKNLRAYIDLGDEIEKLGTAIDYEYFLKQIIDMEEGEEYVKIKLNNSKVSTPKFVIIRNQPQLIKEKPMLRRLKL
tara:strand:- start:334 stop:1089 length:756 start_codon:yes stop_codon:yes gene_type:complete